MKNLARVIFLMAATLAISAQAGWFGGEEAEEKPSRRSRKNRRGEQEADTVEQYDEQYDQGRGANGDYATYDENSRNNNARGDGGGQGRRERIKEMNKKRAKAQSREEMESDQFNRQVLADEMVEETHTPEENLDGYLTDEDINKIWSEHMHDFVPEDMTNVIVENKSTEALMETISHVTPTTVKGAYYVLAGNQDKTISCVVYDPQREVVYKRKGSAQGIILFDTTVPGEYAIIFSNYQSGQDLTVTLALHTYEEKEEHIQFDIDDDGIRYVKEDSDSGASGETNSEGGVGSDSDAASEDEIAQVRLALRDIQVNTKQLQSEAKLSMMRQNGHNEDLLENQDWNFYFMLIEVGCFIGICAFQTHHIKKMLDNKLVI